MAALAKKNGGALTELNPLRGMRELLRWDPFREMAPMFPSAFERPEWSASCDVTETKDAYLFKADVPGVEQEDLEITTSGNRVQISGKRETAYTYERQNGSFRRGFTLPNDADIEHAKSDLQDGVLTLVIPKLVEV